MARKRTGRPAQGKHEYDGTKSRRRSIVGPLVNYRPNKSKPKKKLYA